MVYVKYGDYHLKVVKRLYCFRKKEVTIKNKKSRARDQDVNLFKIEVRSYIFSSVLTLDSCFLTRIVPVFPYICPSFEYP